MTMHGQHHIKNAYVCKIAHSLNSHVTKGARLPSNTLHLFSAFLHGINFFALLHLVNYVI